MVPLGLRAAKVIAIRLVRIDRCMGELPVGREITVPRGMRRGGSERPGGMV